MKILISAFACAPDEGSEPGVGWDWSLQIARRHEVWVLLCDIHQEKVESWRRDHPECSVHFVYVPTLFESQSFTSAKWYLVCYTWQWQAYRIAKTLHAQVKFDLVHHLTYATFRFPSFLPLLDCPFVLGPVGGGEQAALAFYRPREIGWAAAARQYLRLASNYLSVREPLVQWNGRRAASLIVQTLQTKACLPAALHAKVAVFPNNRLDLPAHLFSSRPRPPADELRLLMSGRLLAWKGGHLLLRALALATKKLEPHQRISISFVGDGPFKTRLLRLVQTHRLHSAVRFVPKLGRGEYLHCLGEYHLFALPSFSDGAPLGAVEALAAGLPVLSLEFGGAGHLNDDAFGIKVKAHNPEAAVQGLAEAMLTCLNDPRAWDRKSAAAQRFAARHCDWDETLHFLDGIYHQSCCG